MHERRYYRGMITSFKDSDTEALADDRRVARYARIEVPARKKLMLLDAATCLSDLRMPPGNRLEKLSGDREGYYSIRINDQWRLCFRWTGANAEDVEIVDYH